MTSSVLDAVEAGAESPLLALEPATPWCAARRGLPLPYDSPWRVRMMVLPPLAAYLETQGAPGDDLIRQKSSKHEPARDDLSPSPLIDCDAPGPYAKNDPGRTHKTLKFLQAVSALSFGSFLSIHLLNHAFLIGGATAQSLDMANRFMIFSRVYYHHPWVEPVVIVGGLGLHVGAGAALALQRRREGKTYVMGSRGEPGDRRLKQITSGQAGEHVRQAGWALAVMVPVHAVATRLLPVLYNGDSGFVDYHFAAYSMRLMPIPLSLCYFILAVTGVYHAGWGFQCILRGRNRPRSRRVMWAIGGFCAVMAVAVANLARFKGSIPFEAEHGNMIRAFGSTLSRWGQDVAVGGSLKSPT